MVRKLRTGLIGLLFRLGLGNSLIRRIAAALALGFLVVAPDLNVAQATEVFYVIISGLVLWVSGKAEPQLGDSSRNK